MSATLPLLRRSITLNEALKDDDNILVQLGYPRRQQQFYALLEARKKEIEAAVSFHLRLAHCRIADSDKWLAGSYNVCIPVYIRPPSDSCVLVRIPLPYKLGEGNFPGNVEEKLRCEVASYIWLQENCPDVPIPTLFGFGFPNGRTFTIPFFVPLVSRFTWLVKRTLLSWLGCSVRSRYVPRESPPLLNTGYMIISFVDRGRQLSDTWDKHRHEKELRSNLFHDMARIRLSLSRCPISHIGSLALDDRGIISLSNRPLTLRLQTQENEGIPSAISRSKIYTAVEPYLLDFLNCHDNRIRYQPNSIHNEDDGKQQMAALAAMRATLCRFVSPKYRNGPFVFTLTDLHRSNIIVDDSWRIVSLIDLEWACSLPIELQGPPYWLTGRSVDDIESEEALGEFSQVVDEYLDIFKQEEARLDAQTATHTNIMRKCWESGSYWYFQAVNSPKGMLRIFNHHVQPLFWPAHCTEAIFDQVFFPYWNTDAESLIKSKLKDEETYKDRLREAFASENEADS